MKGGRGGCAIGGGTSRADERERRPGDPRALSVAARRGCRGCAAVFGCSARPEVELPYAPLPLHSRRRARDGGCRHRGSPRPVPPWGGSLGRGGDRTGEIAVVLGGADGRLADPVRSRDPECRSLTLAVVGDAARGVFLGGGTRRNPMRRLVTLACALAFTTIALAGAGSEPMHGPMARRGMGGL